LGQKSTLEIAHFIYVNLARITSKEGLPFPLKIPLFKGFLSKETLENKTNFPERRYKFGSRIFQQPFIARLGTMSRPAWPSATRGLDCAQRA
jgi:hypothetical protein